MDALSGTSHMVVLIMFSDTTITFVACFHLLICADMFICLDFHFFKKRPEQPMAVMVGVGGPGTNSLWIQRNHCVYSDVGDANSALSGCFLGSGIMGKCWAGRKHL